MVRAGRLGAIVLAGLTCGVPARASMVINIVSSGADALTGNALAVAQNAANAWASLFSNDITINVQMSFADLGSGVLGSASTAETTLSYSQVYGSLRAEAGQSGKGALANLPGNSTLLNTTLPSGYSVANTGGVPNLTLATADAKALGYSVGVASDGTIEMAKSYYSGWASGDTTGAFDYESVVIHEIGHVLGFISSEDTVDYDLQQNNPSAIFLTPLDLLRFSGGLPGDFMNTLRDLSPTTGAQVLSDGVVAYSVCTGAYYGSGCQASHWTDTSPAIGVMQYALPGGTVQGITSADIWAMEMIGYDLAVPEPGTVVFLATGLAVLAILRRRRSPRSV